MNIITFFILTTNLLISVKVDFSEQPNITQGDCLLEKFKNFNTDSLKVAQKQIAYENALQKKTPHLAVILLMAMQLLLIQLDFAKMKKKTDHLFAKTTQNNLKE